MHAKSRRALSITREKRKTTKLRRAIRARRQCRILDRVISWQFGRSHEAEAFCRGPNNGNDAKRSNTGSGGKCALACVPPRNLLGPKAPRHATDNNGRGSTPPRKAVQEHQRQTLLTKNSAEEERERERKEKKRKVRRPRLGPSQQRETDQASEGLTICRSGWGLGTHAGKGVFHSSYRMECLS